MTPEQRELRKTKKALRTLADAVLLHLKALDTAMRGPSTRERGERIAKLSGALEFAVDSARYFGLGVDFRRDPKARAREIAAAKKRAGR